MTTTNLEMHLNFFRSLRGKFTFLFLILSLIPLITMGVLVYIQAKNALETEVTHKLVAVRDIKANQIERYFDGRLFDVKVLSNNLSTVSALRAFNEAVKSDMERLSTDELGVLEYYRSLYLEQPELVNADNESAYSAVHAQYHSMFKEYLETYGYFDLFLVEPHRGNILYTMAKENDFGTSLINGLYANTHLGEAFTDATAATSRDFTLLKDFAYYGPSKQAASFLASPIFDSSALVGVLIFQLPIDQINAIMQERTGLGETGETLLISSEDFILRSDSRFSEQSTLLKRKVDTKATRASAVGKAGVKTMIDYRGVPTIIAHTPLNIPHVKWSLNAKIDEAEAFAAIYQTLSLTLILMGLTAITVIGIAFFLGNSRVKPMLVMTEVARQLAVGNMNQTVEVKSQDEIGMMGNAFQQMIINLRQMIEDIVKVSQGLAEGNLRVTPQAEYQGNFVQIKDTLETALSDLRHVIEDIVQVSQKLAEGSTQEITTQAEYRGDFVQIKNALETASVKLAKAATQNMTQDWLKTGQTQLNDKMSGEQDMIKLAKNIITFLATYLEMPVGAFYLLKEATEHQPAHLKLIASYAYTHRKGASNEFLVGDGLVGQAALEKKQIHITKVPENYYISIQSGFGNALPNHILIQPFMYEGVLKGVIELASFKTVTIRQLEFLSQTILNIGVAVNTAESRTRLQSLLQQSQKQAEELQHQQEALQQTNEELQSQSEELQTQAEELQTQQEELRQTNDELEERTKELEQQKAAIQHKNLALEQTKAEMAKTQAAIEIKAQELESASKYKSEFLANMSHELRTPLNSMLILAQLLGENNEGRLSDKQVEYAQTIHSSGSDLLTIINDILDLSKVEAGKIEVHLEKILLADLMETIEQKFRPMAQDKGLAFSMTVAENMPDMLYSDEQRLKQILNNLLSNAFKFTQEGEIRLTMQRPDSSEEVSITGLESAQTIAISVTDTGIGIPKDKQQVIFAAFQQVDGTTSRRYGGTGLGLSISRQLARLLGGEIQLHSEEGKGSIFILYLPEGVPSTQPAKVSIPLSTFVSPQEVTPVLIPLPTEVEPLGNTATQASSPHPTFVSPQESTPIADDRNSLQPDDKSLLIIEDDHKFSKILIDLARQRDFKCIAAENGHAGLQLAERYHPHAIILDVGLPQMDGWTVMDQLKDNPDTRHIPVHFISASDQSLDATKMGAIGYLHKPVSMEQLGAAFKKIEQFMTRAVKNLLVVVDSEPRQQKILELVEGENIQTTLAVTITAAFQQLQAVTFDCIILDIDIEQGSGIKLLEQMQTETELCQMPLIIYAERDLTSAEEALLLRYSDIIPVKSVRSPERLLDEATLFLHQLEAKLPKDKRNMLRVVHDKEVILANKKVLIVDDDVRNTFALATVLEEKNMEVVAGRNGKEALELLNEHSDIAIILMDIMMPEMDGYKTMREIRTQERYRKLPIIALTAKAMKGDKAKCIEAGANDYLSKPVDTNKLISLIRVWLYR